MHEFDIVTEVMATKFNNQREETMYRNANATWEKVHTFMQARTRIKNTRAWALMLKTELARVEDKPRLVIRKRLAKGFSKCLQETLMSGVVPTQASKRKVRKTRRKSNSAKADASFATRV